MECKERQVLDGLLEFHKAESFKQAQADLRAYVLEHGIPDEYEVTRIALVVGSSC